MQISTTEPRSVPGIIHDSASSSYINDPFSLGYGNSYQGQRLVRNNLIL